MKPKLSELVAAALLLLRQHAVERGYEGASLEKMSTMAQQRCAFCKGWHLIPSPVLEAAGFLGTAFHRRAAGDGIRSCPRFVGLYAWPLGLLGSPARLT